jgi:hypothetical protein
VSTQRPVASTTAAIVGQVVRLLAGIALLVVLLCAAGLWQRVEAPGELLRAGVDALSWLGIAAAGIASAGAVARKAPDAAHGLGLGVQGAARAWRGQPAAAPLDPAAGQGEP